MFWIRSNSRMSEQCENAYVTIKIWKIPNSSYCYQQSTTFFIVFSHTWNLSSSNWHDLCQKTFVGHFNAFLVIINILEREKVAVSFTFTRSDSIESRVSQKIIREQQKRPKSMKFVNLFIHFRFTSLNSRHEAAQRNRT